MRRSLLIALLLAILPFWIGDGASAQDEPTPTPIPSLPGIEEGVARVFKLGGVSGLPVGRTSHLVFGAT